MKGMMSGVRYSLLVVAGWIVVVAAHPARGGDLPDCAVRIEVAREGAGTAVKKPWRHEDTAVVLDRDTTAKLAVIVRNEGKAEAFDVSILSAKGLSLTSGGGNRQVTVKSGEVATLPVTVKGSSLADACHWKSRSFQVVVKPAGGSKVCGQVEKRFFCPLQK